MSGGFCAAHSQGLPCLGVENNRMQYVAERKEINMIGIRESEVQAKMLIIKEISLNRFIEGGAAILLALIKNHHKISLGKMESMPRVRSMLRVCVRS